MPIGCEVLRHHSMVVSNPNIFFFYENVGEDQAGDDSDFALACEYFFLHA